MIPLKSTRVISQARHEPCLTSGVSGRPPAAVGWWRDDSPVDSGWFRAPDGSSRCELPLGPLARADLGSRITCRATFHPASPPKSATAAVDMIRE